MLPESFPSGPSTSLRHSISLMPSSFEVSPLLLVRGWIYIEVVALVFDFVDPIYSRDGLSFASLTHLAAIGLISFNSTVPSLQINALEQLVPASYQGDFRFRVFTPQRQFLFGDRTRFG